MVDLDSGRVLHEHNADDIRLIASITKLMTALVAVEREPDLSREITVRAEWLETEGSRIYLRAGENVTMETLLYGLLLESGNDAAMVIACACAAYVVCGRSGTALTVALGAVAGGGVGNMIDRLAQGAVTDFFRTTFVDFPVFNVADIAITCGFVVAFVLYWRQDAARGGADPDEGEAAGAGRATGRGGDS